MQSMTQSERMHSVPLRNLREIGTILVLSASIQPVALQFGLKYKSTKKRLQEEAPRTVLMPHWLSTKGPCEALNEQSYSYARRVFATARLRDGAFEEQ